MKKLINLIVEKREENGETYFLATSDDVQGLVVEWETLEGTIELAHDLAKDLLAVQKENKYSSLRKIFSYSLMVEA